MDNEKEYIWSATEIVEELDRILYGIDPERLRKLGLEGLRREASRHLEWCDDRRRRVSRAEEMGFEVRDDPDQPGRCYYVDPDGNPSDISYDSEEEAWDEIADVVPVYEQAEWENRVTDSGAGPGARR